jgi:hypothetical protein
VKQVFSADFCWPIKALNITLATPRPIPFLPLEFVNLWKNTDPRFQPKVADAKQRLARLRDREAK